MKKNLEYKNKKLQFHKTDIETVTKKIQDSVLFVL